ncbi:MAG: Xaa-Pro peptidase family protein [Kangiellaceae bacterium]|nr:Xaa-Pro peptidase family protein [Kangiellaceae bacterium]
MTIGVGGYTQHEVLSELSDMTAGPQPTSEQEYHARLLKALGLMRQNNLQAMYVNAGTNLSYFTGANWYSSERMVGALLTLAGDLIYIVPDFEIETFKELIKVDSLNGAKAIIHCWHEHESPYQLVSDVLQIAQIEQGSVAIDESTPFFISDGIKQANPNLELVSATNVTATCRMRKSKNELAIMTRAKQITLAVHKAVAKILIAGISTAEVSEFIDSAHRKLGVKGSSFCIVLFGKDTSFPHGVKDPKTLDPDDIVLIDTGCLLHGYNSDITRTYVFGNPTDAHRKIWATEKEAQARAFERAQLGVVCGDVDDAARSYITSQGLGPDYQVPGLPHRTGHGIGLDIHEWPYLVSSDQTPLDVGMCFSNEPMIVIPGEFGIRLEDHFYMTEKGPKWFTQPSHSIDDPFGSEQLSRMD